jgi:hypothetical protein
MEITGWIRENLMQQYELNVGDIKEVKKKFNKAEYNKLYNEKNKEKIKECSRLYNEKNSEKRKEYNKLYNEKNKEKVANSRMRYYENNKEKIKEYSRLYNEKNKEKVVARDKLYYEKNKEKIAARSKLYNEKNKEKVAARGKRYKEKQRNVSSYDDIDILWANFKLSKLKSNLKKRKHLNILVTLTAEDIISLVPKDLKCPVYKESFIFHGRSQWNLSFDRIDNRGGYTKDNVVVVSHRVNSIKSVANVKELYQVADFYYELEKKRLDK